jgi:hypothetical protein
MKTVIAILGSVASKIQQPKYKPSMDMLSQHCSERRLLALMSRLIGPASAATVSDELMNASLFFKIVELSISDRAGESNELTREMLSAFIRIADVVFSPENTGVTMVHMIPLAEALVSTLCYCKQEVREGSNSLRSDRPEL